jgi:glycosyltransferase involved in cell wall biosynthesis
MELSIVMPCLNEAEALNASVQEARATMGDLRVNGEVVVVDNGSSDGSASIARLLGARVVTEARRGYGYAYQRGLRAARGEYLVLADADGTYDLGSLEAFLDGLRGGADLVIGSRLRGEIEPTAMPWLNNHVGNPAVSYVVNLAFGTQVSDAYCGLRALSRAAYDKLDLRAGGMEFAVEMIAEAARQGLDIAEVPVVYRRRKGGVSKLRRWKDGGRTMTYVARRALVRRDRSTARGCRP